MADNDKKMNLRKLNQSERLKIIDKLFEGSNTLMYIFPKKFQIDGTLLRLSKLFFNFREILNLIKLDNSKGFDVNGLKNMLKDWLFDFIKIEPKITPYVHIFCFHIPEFIETHGNLNLFSMQGLEKCNGFSKVNFFRQTNRHKNTFTATLLEKMNRTNFIRLNGNINEKEQEPQEDNVSNDKYADIFDFLLE